MSDPVTTPEPAPETTPAAPPAPASEAAPAPSIEVPVDRAAEMKTVADKLAARARATRTKSETLAVRQRELDAREAELKAEAERVSGFKSNLDTYQKDPFSALRDLGYGSTPEEILFRLNAQAIGGEHEATRAAEAEKARAEALKTPEGIERAIAEAVEKRLAEHGRKTEEEHRKAEMEAAKVKVAEGRKAYTAAVSGVMYADGKPVEEYALVDAFYTPDDLTEAAIEAAKAGRNMRASEILAAARTDIESRLEKLGYRKAAPTPAPAPVAPAAPATPAPTLDNRMAGSAAVQADPFAGLDERDARRLRAIKALEGLNAPKA